MQFLADESCDFAVVNALREAGHDVIAVKDVLPAAPDEAVISFAEQGARVLLTEDKDFGQLVFSSAMSSPGVIFIRFPGNARQAMVHTVIELVNKKPEKIKGRFAVVQPGRIRVSEH